MDISKLAISPEMEAIASYIEQTGHTGLAGRIRNKFLGSGK